MGLKYKGSIVDDQDVVNKKYADWESGRFTTMPTPTAALVGKFCRYTGATTTTEPVYVHGGLYRCDSDTTTSPVSYKWTYVADNSAYLPVTGGTMSGEIISDATYAITGTNDSGFIGFHGGSTQGASLFLDGKSSSANGAFFLQSCDGTNTVGMIGKADGTLTWGDLYVYNATTTLSGQTRQTVFALASATESKTVMVSKVMFSAAESPTGNASSQFYVEVHSTGTTAAPYGYILAKNRGGFYLCDIQGTTYSAWRTIILSTGGSMTGSLIVNCAANKYFTAYKGGSTDSSLVLFSGTTHNDGAWMRLNGLTNNGTGAATGGAFLIHSHNSDGSKEFIGKADGTLTWGGTDIPCEPTYDTLSTQSEINTDGRFRMYRFGKMRVLHFDGVKSSDTGSSLVVAHLNKSYDTPSVSLHSVVMTTDGANRCVVSVRNNSTKDIVFYGYTTASKVMYGQITYFVP